MILLLLRILGTALVFVMLTALTQVGGVIYLLTLLISKLIRERISNRILRWTFFPLAFLIIYTLTTAIVVPVVAKKVGRVPMPWSGTLRPRTIFTCVLNRHYVRADLKQLSVEASQKIQKAFPGTVVNYLDAGFPFYDGFPLPPHLSHNDGRKLDIALFYTDTSGIRVDDTPSAIGYGVFVDPRPGDKNYLEICERKGYWQYGAMAKIISQERKKDFRLDARRQKAFIDILTKDKRLQILLIEPHLQARMNLASSKIRFHGCHAVRHDDHIHIQVK